MKRRIGDVVLESRLRREAVRTDVHLRDHRKNFLESLKAVVNDLVDAAELDVRVFENESMAIDADASKE